MWHQTRPCQPWMDSHATRCTSSKVCGCTYEMTLTGPCPVSQSFAAPPSFQLVIVCIVGLTEWRGEGGSSLSGEGGGAPTQSTSSITDVEACLGGPCRLSVRVGCPVQTLPLRLWWPPTHVCVFSARLPVQPALAPHQAQGWWVPAPGHVQPALPAAAAAQHPALQAPQAPATPPPAAMEPGEV